MKFARLSLFFLSLSLGGIFCVFPALAAEEKPSSEQLKSDLGEIKARLTTIEQQQKEILAKEDKIFEELERVRVWVHKR
jgi:hypothetical protein